MKSVMKKALALFLCLWMTCLIGITAFAGSEQPFEKPSSIKLSSEKLSMLYGGTAKLTATVLPEGSDQRVTWKSSDPALLQVDAYGNLTASKDTADEPSGKKTATITVTSVADTSITAKCEVTVDNDSATKYGDLFKKILAAIKSIIAAFGDPSKELLQQVVDFVKKLADLLLKQA